MGAIQKKLIAQYIGYFFSRSRVSGDSQAVLAENTPTISKATTPLQHVWFVSYQNK